MKAYIICGSRNGVNQDHFNSIVNEIEIGSVIISGGASGVDFQAKEFAINNEMVFMEFPADWDTYGRSAGPKRNLVMANILKGFEEKGYECEVLAFSGEVGTDNMIKTASELGLKVRKV